MHRVYYYLLLLLFHGQVTLHDPLEGALELLVGGGVAEGIDGAVEVAEEVGEHVNVDVDAAGAEAGDDGEDVVGRPAGDEGAQDDRDHAKGLQSGGQTLFSINTTYILHQHDC